MNQKVLVGLSNELDELVIMFMLNPSNDKKETIESKRKILNETIREAFDIKYGSRYAFKTV